MQKADGGLGGCRAAVAFSGGGGCVPPLIECILPEYLQLSGLLCGHRLCTPHRKPPKRPRTCPPTLPYILFQVLAAIHVLSVSMALPVLDISHTRESCAWFSMPDFSGQAPCLQNSPLSNICRYFFSFEDLLIFCSVDAAHFVYPFVTV